MTYQAIPDSANFFYVRNKRNPNAPDLKGEVILSEDLMNELVSNWKAGTQPRIDIAIWKKTSERAGEYFSLRVSKRAAKKSDDVPF